MTQQSRSACELGCPVNLRTSKSGEDWLIRYCAIDSNDSSLLKLRTQTRWEEADPLSEEVNKTTFSRCEVAR
jgi:hypothetical protein